jgi:hypothetical protein
MCAACRRDPNDIRLPLDDVRLPVDDAHLPPSPRTRSSTPRVSSIMLSRRFINTSLCD